MLKYVQAVWCRSTHIAGMAPTQPTTNSLLQVRAAQQAQTCWSAVVAARQDADFQADLQQQHVRKALADIQSSGGWDKYAQDAQVGA